jgi:hypothetical protein
LKVELQPWEVDDWIAIDPNIDIWVRMCIVCPSISIVVGMYSNWVHVFVAIVYPWGIEDWIAKMMMMIWKKKNEFLLLV